MFREPRQRSTRKQLEKDRMDPVKSHKPEPPVAGPGNQIFEICCQQNTAKAIRCLFHTIIENKSCKVPGRLSNPALSHGKPNY